MISIIAGHLGITVIDRSVVRAYFPNVLIDIIGACSASYIIICFCRKFEMLVIEKGIFVKLYNFLCYFGKYSSLVLCFHLIEMKFFPWGVLFRLSIPDFMKYIIVFISKVCVCSCCVWIIEKNKKLKRMFY